MNRYSRFAWLCVAVAPIFLISSVAGGMAEEIKKPRLILQITVDQLRGDFPWRYYDRLGEGGFRYLAERGTVYRNAHHRHANTETIVGHVTLATGADPAAHGMVGNVWLDRDSGALKYNVEDARYPILRRGGGCRQGNGNRSDAEDGAFRWPFAVGNPGLHLRGRAVA